MESPVEDLMMGAKLRQALGFKSGEAFRLAARQGRVPVPIFKIPGRKGWFANGGDVRRWRSRLSAPCAT